MRSISTARYQTRENTPNNSLSMTGVSIKMIRYIHYTTDAKQRRHDAMITTHTNQTAEQAFDMAKEAIEAGHDVQIIDGTEPGKMHVVVDDHGTYTK